MTDTPYEAPTIEDLDADGDTLMTAPVATAPGRKAS